ncbi:MAG TPA: hypothetical protein VIL99_05575 [Ignavibacteria bacterium]|jgi:hypothetical protein
MGLVNRNAIIYGNTNLSGLITIVENLFIKENEFPLFTISYGVNLLTVSGFI